MKYAYLLPLVLTGCVDNTLSMSIIRFGAIQSSAMCVVSSAPTVVVSEGLLDVGVVQLGAQSGVHGYIAAPIVRNNMIDRAVMSGGIEMDAIDITGFDIVLEPDATLAPALPLSQRSFFLEAAGGRIEPGGAMSGSSSAAVSAEIVPAQIALELLSAVPTTATTRPLLTVHMRPRGDHHGEGLSGGWVDFPVHICNLCLIGQIGACPMGGFASNSVNLGGCFPEQDQAITCCTQGGALLCGKFVPTHT